MTNGEPATSDLDKLLEYIRQHRGFDFTGYKRASLERRLNKRMQTVKVSSYSEYLDYLQVQPDEFIELFNTILINVTRFFRDSENWKYLASHVLPQIIDTVGEGDMLRVWNPGCSSGQESCTIAILLAEALGLDACRERVKIYGTDVDEDALSQARVATYSAADTEHLPEGLRQKYFEEQAGRYVLNRDLRRCIIYGRHDLVQDAPISRVDLLICRNTLMYFNTETQSRILTNFHFALKDSGALFLGKGEMLLTQSTRFAPIQLKQRVFRKIPSRHARLRPLPRYDTPEMERFGPEASDGLRSLAFESSSIMQLVLDSDNNLVLANARARASFAIREQDLGRPIQDFQVSYEPTNLRSKIEDARAEQRSTIYNDVRWSPPASNDVHYLDLEIIPLFADDGATAGVHVTFVDSSRQKELQLELDRARQDLETAHEELESTVEEVETTNEELQSTNEELETMNEELQSTNEELETMNEELQSTNEELEAINDELRARTTDLNRVNAYLESILTSLSVGVVVVDPEFEVQMWNGRTSDLWGLRSDEVVGTHFLNLDIGLPVDQLRPLIRECLSGDRESAQITLRAVNRTGRRIDCTITCMPLISQESDIYGAIMLMETAAASQD